MFCLDGKKCLVTGAGSGIGAAIAQLFAKQKAFIYVVDVNEKAGNTVVSEIIKAKGKAAFIHLDIRDESQCNEVAVRIHKECPQGLDVLVNNAAIGHVGTILETKTQDFDRLYEVNVKGVFFLNKLFLPPMIQKRKGSIINMASIGGVVGITNRFAYCMTKFAVVGMTKSMALDCAFSGVRVNCICPARVETNFAKARIQESPDPKKAYQEMTTSQALGRMAQPEEIAGAALYLASDESAFVTGSEFIIDGGFSSGK